jgi:hypothetical protein
MSWAKVTLRLQEEKRNLVNGDEPTAMKAIEHSHGRKPIWDRLGEIVRNDLADFNDARGAQFQPIWNDFWLQVIPKQPPIDTVILHVDERTGVITLTCPISHPGVPRRGTFKISGERIESLGDFVGEPSPASQPMTPAEFSEFVLKPLVFPKVD